MDGFTLITGGISTCSNNWIPIKINILIWRVRISSIPTSERLSYRGILEDSILCPLCSSRVEIVDHIFVECIGLIALCSCMVVWWGVTLPSQIIMDSLINWETSTSLRIGQRKAFDTVILTSFWCI